VRLGLARGFGLAEADGEGACVEGSGAADGDGVSALEAIGACAHPPSTISPDINDVEMIRSAARLRSRIVVERYPIIVASRTARPRAGTNSGPVSDAHDLALQAHDMGGRVATRCVRGSHPHAGRLQRRESDIGTARYPGVDDSVSQRSRADGGHVTRSGITHKLLQPDHR
jgi:hypothetical protein